MYHECSSHIKCSRVNYRPQRSCGQGYVFTRVCDSVNRGGSPGRENPPGQVDPPGTRQTPPDQGEPPPGPGRTPRTRQTPPGPGRTPPGADTTPPGSRHPPTQCMLGDTVNKSTSGQYASYWNSILLHLSVSSGGMGFCPSMHHRSHDWGGVCRGGLCPEGRVCPGGSLSRVSLSGDPPMVTSRRYASYWNAFLFEDSLIRDCNFRFQCCGMDLKAHFLDARAERILKQ